MSEKRDYYEVLEVKKDATDKQIKKAYHKLAKKHHPDAGGDKDKFQEIQEAYEVLSDKDKKARYDKYGHAGMGGAGRQPNYDDIEDILRGFESRFRSGFGGGQRMVKGQNLRLNIKLTLEEILNGTTKKIKYNRQATCKPCNGNGGTDEETCKTCEGHGIVVKVIRRGNGMMHMQSVCPACNGAGKTYKNVCGSCSGHGTTQKEEYVEIDIPHGVRNGDNLLMQNMGHAVKGGVEGDLIVILTELPHKEFVRSGNDLKKKITLSYPDLMLGAKVDVPTIEGKKIRVDIPELSNVGKNLRITNKGMKIHGSELRGDMILELDMEMPKSLSPEEKELIEKLKNLKNSDENSE